MKIDGKKIAQDILENLRQKVEELKQRDVTPKLAIILVGNDPASVAYVRQKELKAKSIGAEIEIINLSVKVSESEILKRVRQFNNDNNIHGVIVQQPLPQNINADNIVQAVNPKKDVDGFHPKSKFQMPIATAVLEILKIISVPIPFIEWLKSKKIVVIGKGETGGKPIIKLFRNLGIILLIIDSKVINPDQITRNADLIISAVGKPDIVKAENIKKNVILIGIGLHTGTDGKMKGDYDEEKIQNIASLYTPTPGGVGPINVAMLLKNLIVAAETTY